MNQLIQQIINYIPFNEQEQHDKQLILSELKNNPKVFSRDSLLAHMTASAWVVNSQKNKVLMAYHNIYNSWSWLGGHADDMPDLLEVAIKEVKEESGIKYVKPLSFDIYSLEVLTVDGHIKHGKYVSSHLHLNVTYLLEASEADKLIVKPDENSNVAWFSLEDAVTASKEPWFQTHVYPKLNQKLAVYKKEN